MGLRFYRRIRLLPGVRANLSRSGVSTSIGGRGHWLTFGRRGTRVTASIPGTGISYTHQSAVKAPRAAHVAPVTEPSPKGRAWRGWLWVLLLVAIAIALGRHFE
jgi:Protein of unknown function (DUF4236)